MAERMSPGDITQSLIDEALGGGKTSYDPNTPSGAATDALIREALPPMQRQDWNAPANPPMAGGGVVQPQGGGLQDQIMQGLTLGYEPQIAAGLQAVRRYFTGEPGSYSQDVAGNQAGLDQYRAENPWTATGGQIAGSLVGTMVPLGVATRGLAAGGRAIAEVAPKVAEGFNALTQGSKFGRAVSAVAANTAEGAGAAALQNHLTGNDLSTDMTIGGLIGGVAGTALKYAVPAVTSLAAKVSPETAKKVAYLQSIGVAPKAHQVVEGTDSGGKQIQQTAKQLGVTGDQAQLEGLTKKTTDLIGLDAKTLEAAGEPQGVITDRTLPLVQQNFANKFDTFRAKVDNAFDQQTGMEINSIRQRAQSAGLDRKQLGEVNDVIQRINQRIQANGGKLSGQQFMDITGDGGLLDLRLLGSDSGALRRIGGQIKDVLNNSLDRAATIPNNGLTPEEVAAFRQTKMQYRNYVRLAGLQDGKPSSSSVLGDALKSGGYVSPSKLAQHVTDNGELGQLAQAATILKDAKATPTGGTAPPRVNLIPTLWNKAKEYSTSLGLGAGTVGGMSYMTQGADNLAPLVLGGVGAAAGGLARIIGNHFTRAALESPEMVNRLLVGGRGGVVPISRQAIVPGMVTLHNQLIGK